MQPLGARPAVAGAQNNIGTRTRSQPAVPPRQVPVSTPSQPSAREGRNAPARITAANAAAFMAAPMHGAVHVESFVVPQPATRSMPTATGVAAEVVLSFIEALNNRDLSGMLLLVAPDCLHEDLSYQDTATSKEEVARFYTEVVSSMPERVQVVVDDITGGDDCKAGVMWHMEVDGTEVPCSRGLSFYRVSPEGPGGAHRITYVRQSPEHFVKLSGMALSAAASATPLIDTLGPMALPSFWSNLARGASNIIAAAPPVEEVLMSLAAAGAANTVPQVPNFFGSAFSTMAPTPASPPSAAHRASAAAAAPPQRPLATSAVAASAAAAAVGAATAAAPPRSATVVYAAAVMEAPPAVVAPPAPAQVAQQAVPMVTLPRPASAPASPAASPSQSAASLASVDGAVSTQPAAAASTRAASALSSASTMDDEPPTASAAASAFVAVAEAPAAAASAAAARAAVARAPAAAPLDPAVAVANLAGVWEKDLEVSDVEGYEKALDMWQISGVQKATARLIEGLELSHSPARGGKGAALNVHFLTMIPYFKVTEVYPLDGSRAKMRRRDQRGGDAVVAATVAPAAGAQEASSSGVVCHASWGAPFAGSMEERYECPPGQPDVLHVTSTLRLGDKAATTLQVYHRRRGMSARDVISASEKRNGKASDVLGRFGMRG